LDVFVLVVPTAEAILFQPARRIGFMPIKGVFSFEEDLSLKWRQR